MMMVPDIAGNSEEWGNAIGDRGQGGGIIFYVVPAGFKLYQGTNSTLASDTYITAYYLEAWFANDGSSI